LRAKSIRELATVCVQETNAEPLLPIGQTPGLDFKELQQVTGERRLIHFLFREDRQQALNDFISTFPIGQSRAERPHGIQDIFLIISVKSVLQPLELMVHAEIVWHSITIPLESAFLKSGIYSRYAMLRAGLRRKEEFASFLYPALIPQLASSPRERTGLTCGRASGASSSLPWQYRLPCVTPVVS
jgi:hypothetical protein